MRDHLGVTVTLAFVLAACGGRPGPGNFEKFTANENGVRVLERYIQDTSNPDDARVEAAVTLVQGGWALHLRKVLDGCPDREDLAAQTAEALIRRLPDLAGTPDVLAATRDGTFIALSLAPAAERGPLQKRLADWVFAGLGPESSADEVKKAVESRALVAQIADLGPHGADGATWMIRHGFAVEKLSQYLLSLKDAEVEAKMLAAFKALHATPDIAIPSHHVEAIGTIRSTDAVEYLLDLAQDDGQEPDIRSLAFNQAAEALDRPEGLRGARDPILARLRKMIARNDPDDRWAAARYLVNLEGIAALDEVLAALQDDGVYPRALEDPRKTLVDFCKGVILRDRPLGAGGPGEGGRVRPIEDVLRTVKRLLASSNRVHQALGVVCVKATEDPTYADLLKPLQKSRVSLEPVIGEKVTLGTLAQNAADGLALMAEVQAAQASGALSAEDAKRKRFFALVDLLDTGDALRKAVEERFAEASRARKP